ncbi:MAG: hypothetical protein FWE28_06625 [Oscillospiraceae bacterium]|nr:hypothetical protein [Oscillospiraceae bacterium]
MKRVLIIALIVLGVSVLFSSCVVNPAIGPERMERIFEEDYELLAIVRDYFISSGHESIFLHHTTESEAISLGGRSVEIEDDEVIETISTLWEQGYRSIGRRGNAIYFQTRFVKGKCPIK